MRPVSTFYDIQLSNSRARKRWKNKMENKVKNG